MSERTWLVTGGAGFIGSNFVRFVLDRHPDLRIVVLDKLTYAGSLENLSDLPGEDRFTFVRGDVASSEDVRGCFAAHAPDAVVHFAAETHVDRSIVGPRDFIETNVSGTFELLEASRVHLSDLDAASRERFRFLQISTDEVFGSLGPEGHFTETSPYAPNSPYSASKAGADHLVRAYHRTYGLPAITSVCSNNFGPRQLPEKLIPLMTLTALAGEPLPIYGDGENVRDWIHVEDHCVGIERALERGRPGERYAFGGGNERTNLEVVGAICEALETLRPAASNPALVRRGVRGYRDLMAFVPDRLGHDRRYGLDGSRTEAALAWRPERDFDEALRETVAWYVDRHDKRTDVDPRPPGEET